MTIATRSWWALGILGCKEFVARGGSKSDTARTWCMAARTQRRRQRTKRGTKNCTPDECPTPADNRCGVVTATNAARRLA